MSPKHIRIIQELRWIANLDDIDHSICYSADDAADVIERAAELLEAIDRATEVLGSNNPYYNDIRQKREALR